jgi:hypothetical protein
MRKAMICVSVMLALFQLWPMVFGRHATSNTAGAAVVAAAPRVVQAVAIAEKVPQMTPASVSVPAPRSCYTRYKAEFQQCRAGDQLCHAKMAEHWDLCEATGMWPE